MNIITWNVRGLDRLRDFLVRDFLSLHCVDVCCLQESKWEDLLQGLWREIGGPLLNHYISLSACGSAGVSDGGVLLSKG